MSEPTRLEVWRYVWGWRLSNWRCWVFGHAYGKEEHQYEIGVRYESWVTCGRCGYADVTYSVYGGQTLLGKKLGF